MKYSQRKAGALLSYTLTVTNVIVSLVYVPILIFFLGQKEYGLYQLMGSILVYLNLFDFGLSNTVTRYYSKFIALKDEKGKENLLALSTMLYSILTFLLIVAGTVFYFYIDNIFSNSLSSSEIIIAKKMYIIIIISAAITISTSVFNSIINANERFVFLRVLSIVQILMRPILVVAIFSIEASALIVVVIQALINLFGVVMKMYYSLIKLKVKIKFHYYDVPLLKELVRYSSLIFITSLMDQIFWRSDQIILGIVVGTASVAVYSISSLIVMNYMNLSLAISGVFLPNITKRVTEKASNDELSNIFIKLGRIQYILLGIVLVGFILFGKEFISIWIGNDFEEAYYITLIVMIPFTIDLIQNIGLTILQAKNMYGFRAIVFFFMSIINLAFSIPLALHYGGIGAAAATGISYLIGNGIIMNVYYFKVVKLNISRFWKEITKLSVSIIIVYIVGQFITEINFLSPAISLLCKLILFLFLYSIVMWKIGLNSYEKSLIGGLLKRFTNIRKKS